jgi:hypothetical protein
LAILILQANGQLGFPTLKVFFSGLKKLGGVLQVNATVT